MKLNGVRSREDSMVCSTCVWVEGRMSADESNGPSRGRAVHLNEAPQLYSTSAVPPDEVARKLWRWHLGGVASTAALYSYNIFIVIYSPVAGTWDVHVPQELRGCLTKSAGIYLSLPSSPPFIAHGCASTHVGHVFIITAAHSQSGSLRSRPNHWPLPVSATICRYTD